MRCGSCKHWGDHRDAGEKWRRCLAVIHDVDGTISETCHTPIEERDWLTEEQRVELVAIRDTAKVICQDGSGYFAAVRCREDFGCILYEPLQIIIDDDGEA
jgi:hypothetical protein